MPPCGIPQPQLGSPQPAAAFPALTNPKFSTSCAPAVYRPGVGSIFHGVRSLKAPFTAAADPERPIVPGNAPGPLTGRGGETSRAGPNLAEPPRPLEGCSARNECLATFCPKLEPPWGELPAALTARTPSRAVLCSALPCRPAPCRAVPCPSPAARAQCAPAPSPLRIGPRRPHITEARRGD